MRHTYYPCVFSTVHLIAQSKVRPGVKRLKVIFMYRQFNIQQFYVLPTHCIYGFCVDLRTNSDYFPIQH